MGLLPMEMNEWCSWSVSCMISARNNLNRMGESKYPRRTPTVVLETSLSCLFKVLHCWSSLIVPEWLELVFQLCWSFWGPATGLHARLCQTPSWSLWSCRTDRTGVVVASLWWLKCRRSFCSTVLQPGLKPAYSSASSSSTFAFSQLRITQSTMLLGWLIRLMVWYFWHCLRLPL